MYLINQPSRDQKFILSIAVYEAKQAKGIVQIIHGMAEYKERYIPFMEALNEAGFTCVIHDHRGHGDSLGASKIFGHYENGEKYAIVEDVQVVREVIREQVSSVLPLYVFAHSMGTLVARMDLKQHDNQIEKLILCGPPTQNSLARMGVWMSQLLWKLKGGSYTSRLLHTLIFANYNKKFNNPYGLDWLSSDPKQVELYAKHPKAGFLFKVDGFVSLISMMQACYQKDYQVTQPNLYIWMMAGSEDPVIQSIQKFMNTKLFLNQQGYQNIKTTLYTGLRHELIHEVKRKEIINQIITFLSEKSV